MTTPTPRDAFKLWKQVLAEGDPAKIQQFWFALSGEREPQVSRPEETSRTILDAHGKKSTLPTTEQQFGEMLSRLNFGLTIEQFEKATSRAEPHDQN